MPRLPHLCSNDARDSSISSHITLRQKGTQRHAEARGAHWVLNGSAPDWKTNAQTITGLKVELRPWP